MKFHVNNKDQTRRCLAVIKCRYGDDQHFSTAEEGVRYVETKRKEENSKNILTSLKKAPMRKSGIYPIVDSSGANDLIDWEKEDARMSIRLGEREEITTPDHKDFRKSQAVHFTFFTMKVKSKTGLPVEHVVLGNPDILTEKSYPNHNAVARGVICRSDIPHKSGMLNQYGLRYAIVDAVNAETKQHEQVLVIESISVPSDMKGKGIASELIDEAIKAFPNARIPETRSMTKEGKQLFKRLQATRGDKFKGLIKGNLTFEPNSEGEVNYVENPRDFER